MTDKFINVAGTLLGVTIFFAMIFGAFYIFSLLMEIPCSVKAKAQSMEYKYGVVMGCMVKYKGEWVDYDRLRYVE